MHLTPLLFFLSLRVRMDRKTLPPDVDLDLDFGIVI